MEESLFKPRRKVIEHKDSEREKTIEKGTGIDLEYCRDFRKFLEKVFKEANLSASSDNLTSLLSELHASESGFGTTGYSPYLVGIYNNLAEGVNGDLSSRAYIDEEIYSFVSSRKNKDDLDQAFKDKVNLDVILKHIENENDIARKNVLILIAQIINREAIPKTENELEIKFCESSYGPGGCWNAEKHMLAFLSGKHEDQLEHHRQRGYINLILDEKGEPVMVEKMNLGDSNSCVSLRPLRLDGVLIPAGAMFGSEPKQRFSKKNEKLQEVINLFEKRNKRGGVTFITTLKDYYGFEFIRMSLISLPEDLKPKIGGHHYKLLQREENYINYDWITADVIFDYTKGRLDEVRKKLE